MEGEGERDTMKRRDVPVDPLIQEQKDTCRTYFSRQNAVLYDQIYEEEFGREGENYFVKAERALARYFREKEMILRENDIFAGQIQNLMMRFSQPLPEDGEPETFDPAVILNDGKESWLNAKATVDAAREYGLNEADQEDAEFLVTGLKTGYLSHYIVGHVVIGFQNIVGKGFGRIIEEIKGSLGREGLTEEQVTIGQCMLDSVRDMQEYMDRYIQLAEEIRSKASSEDSEWRMARIIDSLNWLKTGKPRNLYDAVHLIILFHEMVTTQTKGSMSFGRLDQILGPYYEADLAAGNETRESAQILIDAAVIKFAGGIAAYQNLTLGGCDGTGAFAGNDISLMFLAATRRLMFDQPLTSYRVTKDLPEEHWNAILRTIEKGAGFPALFNDDVVIPSKLKQGVPLEDARNYSMVGCVETSIGGKEYSNTEGMRINWSKIIEGMLNEGKDPGTGLDLKFKKILNLEEIGSFEEFLAWYREELEGIIERAVNICCINERFFYKRFPATVLSLSIENCIGTLDDCTHKGAVYSNTCINHTGMSNAIDSLLSIKKLVFEEHRVTLRELAEILRNDFAGSEELLKEIDETCPKFGNGEEEADELAALLINEAAEKTQSYENERGGRFNTGFYSVAHHGAMGRLTGALPNGKRAGEALANGMSPVQGADRNSPLAVINSMRRLDQTNFGNGMVLDLKFSPSFFDKEVHEVLFRNMLDVYFEEGGLEVQINMIDRDTLIDAQIHPEKHQDLVVRVSGFSAYFVTLFKELQDEIIKRTEYEG